MKDYEDILAAAIKEIRSLPDFDSMTLWDIALRYADQVDDDFSNACDAIYNDLLTEFNLD